MAGRFDAQRTPELSWIRLIVADPRRIVPNWQALGRGDEAYVRNFGNDRTPIYHILVCEILGRLRQAITVFPRDHIGEKEFRQILWPKGEEAI